MPTSQRLRIFLCHAKEDKPAVREIYRKLVAEGWLDVWLDDEKLLPGQEWTIEIEKAVETADVVAVCLSNKSVDKEGYVQKEIRFVLNIADEKPEGTIFVIPLRLDDCVVPRRLRAWQWVDYFPKTKKKLAYQHLLESLKLRDQKLGIVLDGDDFPDPPDPPNLANNPGLFSRIGKILLFIIIGLVVALIPYGGLINSLGKMYGFSAIWILTSVFIWFISPYIGKFISRSKAKKPPQSKKI